MPLVLRRFLCSVPLTFALTGSIGSASLAQPSTASAAKAAKCPNIVLIIADDLGWTDLHTGRTSFGNGSKYHQTPNLDKLAEQGMSFTSAYTNQNCQPSRAALLTGQYAPHNGVYNVGSLNRGSSKSPLLIGPAQRTSIRAEAVTVAETLKAAGYVTAHVGKFHVSETPGAVQTAHGFDFNYGGGVKGDGGPAGYFAVEGPGRGWHFQNMGPQMDPFAAPYTPEYIDKNLRPFAQSSDPSTLAGTAKHLTDADADAAIDFLTRHEAGPDKNKPFFMNVAFNAVHAAIRARPDLAAKYRALPSTDPRQKKFGYAALTEGMDQAVGRILARLDDPNGDGDKSDSIAGNTLVVFVSDNGGFGNSTDNTPLRGSKGMLSEGGIRVPLIARLPGVITPGAVSNAAVHLVDFYPTFAEFAHATVPKPQAHLLDGASLAGLLRGTRKVAQVGGKTRTTLFWHFPGYLDTRAVPCSVITKDRADGKRYKLMYFYEDRHYELYNLTDDLSEKTNLLGGGKAATGPVRTIASELRGDLVAWLAQVKPAALTVAATHQPVPPPVALESANFAVPRFEGRVSKGGGANAE